MSSPASPPPVRFPLPRKLVVIGDLSGDDDALEMMLRGLGLTNKRGRFTARGVHLVQLGDVVNRGTQCRQALERLLRLEREALEVDSRVTVLLGNHEAMVTLGNLAWCSPEEILEHATPEERAAYEARRTRAIYQLLHEAGDGVRTAPVVGRLRAWEEANVPGRAAFLREMGPDGFFGRFIRRMPAAIQVGPVLLVHGGLSLALAARGLEALQAELAQTWAARPALESDLPPDHVLFADDGPLWHRRYALSDDPAVAQELDAALLATGASVMMVGHTRTDQIPGGRRGHPLVRFGGKLVCADVGIGSSGGAPAAVFVEKGAVWAWRPEERKRRLCALAAELPDAPPAAPPEVGAEVYNYPPGGGLEARRSIRPPEG